MNFLSVLKVLALAAVQVTSVRIFEDKIDHFDVEDDLAGHNALNINVHHYFLTPNVDVECVFDQDTLQLLNLENVANLEWNPEYGIFLKFINCFRNDTKLENYRSFVLQYVLDGVKNIGLDYSTFQIRFDKYALVDGNVFFYKFAFEKYKELQLFYMGLTTSEFLQYKTRGKLLLYHTNEMNFVNFGYNNMTELTSTGNKILNLNTYTLERFNNLSRLSINNFSFNGDNPLYQPAVFASCPTLEVLLFTKSDRKVILHDDVFLGANNLKSLDLADLHLDTIAPILFSRLPKLESLDISDNHIVDLDPYTFANNRVLGFVSLGGNQLLESGHPVDLIFGYNSVRLSLVRGKIESYHLIEPLLINPNITAINFEQVDFTNLTLLELLKLKDRPFPIDLNAPEGDVTIDLGRLRRYHVNFDTYVKFTKQQEQLLNAKIILPLFDTSKMCNDCRFIPEIFLNYLTGYKDEFNVLLRDPKILLVFILNCIHLEDHYTITYTENCPSNCLCRYNRFLDKAVVDCSNKGLAELPIIPFPSQFQQLDSMDLNFTNNRLKSLNFDKQDDRVLKILSTFDFDNNAIEKINFFQKSPADILNIRLCGNPFLDNENVLVQLNVESKWTDVTHRKCHLGYQYPDKATDYIAQKSIDDIMDILYNEKCA